MTLDLVVIGPINLKFNQVQEFFKNIMAEPKQNQNKSQGRSLTMKDISSLVLSKGSYIKSYEITSHIDSGPISSTYIATKDDQEYYIEEYLPLGIGLYRTQDGRLRIAEFQSFDDYEIGKIKAYNNFLSQSYQNIFSGMVAESIQIIEANNTIYFICSLPVGQILNEAIGKNKDISEKVIFALLKNGLNKIEKLNQQGLLNQNIQAKTIYVTKGKVEFLSPQYPVSRLSEAQDDVFVKNTVSYYWPAVIHQRSDQKENQRYVHNYQFASTLYYLLTTRPPVDLYTRQRFVEEYRQDPVIPLALIFKNKYHSKLLNILDRMMSTDLNERLVDLKELVEVAKSLNIYTQNKNQGVAEKDDKTDSDITLNKDLNETLDSESDQSQQNSKSKASAVKLSNEQFNAADASSQSTSKEYEKGETDSEFDLPYDEDPYSAENEYFKKLEKSIKISAIKRKDKKVNDLNFLDNDENDKADDFVISQNKRANKKTKKKKIDSERKLSVADAGEEIMPPAEEKTSSWFKSIFKLLILLLFGVILFFAGWWLKNSDFNFNLAPKRDSSDGIESSSVITPIVEPSNTKTNNQISAFLSEARTAVSKGYYYKSEEDIEDKSAHAYYHKVLLLDDNNKEAIKGLKDIADKYYLLTKSAINRKDVDLSKKRLKIYSNIQYEQLKLDELKNLFQQMAPDEDPFYYFEKGYYEEYSNLSVDQQVVLFDRLSENINKLTQLHNEEQSIQAKFILAYLYYKGILVEPNKAEGDRFLQQSVEILEELSKSAYADAWVSRNLGLMFENGWHYDQNLEFAMTMFTKAAYNDDALAQYKMSQIIDDESKSAEWLEKAKNNGIYMQP